VLTAARPSAEASGVRGGSRCSRCSTATFAATAACVVSASRSADGRRGRGVGHGHGELARVGSSRR
jgi:hypothetical protein